MRDRIGCESLLAILGALPRRFAPPKSLCDLSNDRFVSAVMPPHKAKGPAVAGPFALCGAPDSAFGGQKLSVCAHRFKFALIDKNMQNTYYLIDLNK